MNNTSEGLKAYLDRGQMTATAWKSFHAFMSALMFSDMCRRAQDPKEMANGIIAGWKRSVDDEVSSFADTRRTTLADPGDTEETIINDINSYAAGAQDAKCDVEMALRRLIAQQEQEYTPDGDVP